MNKLEIYNNGGEPFTLNDLKFLESALTEGLVGLASILNNNLEKAVILSGINLTNTSAANWSWSSGYVYINGEIFKVEAGSLVVTGYNSILWDFDFTNDPNGEKTFEDLTVYQTYKIRKAKIVQGMPSVPPIGSSYVNTVNSTSHISKYLMRLIDTNTEASAIFNSKIAPEAWNLSLPAFDSGWSNYGTGAGSLRLRKTKTNEVVLGGMVTNASISGSNLRICTLPVGYRPLQLVDFTVKDQQGEIRNIQIQTNGRVNVYGTTGVPTTLSLDSIRFYTD